MYKLEMANYINIGSSCATFSYETQPTGYTTIYVRNGNGVPLNPSGTVNSATGYPLLTGTSNTFNYSSIAFNVYFNESLMRFSTGRENWRYLGTTAPTWSESGTVPGQTVTTASSWPASQTGISLAVTHPASGGTSYTIVTGTDSALETWLKGTYVALPSIPAAADTVTTSLPLYLYEETDTTTYVLNTAGALSTVKPSTAGGVQASAFYFSYRVSTGTSITLGLSTTSGGSGSFAAGIIYLLNGKVEVTIAGVKRTFLITATQPSIGENPAGFPASSSTLLKHVNSGKYVYWNGITTSGAILPTTVYTNTSLPSLSLIDYWRSGITSGNIMKGLQFKFWDLTGVSSSSGTTTIGDWYGWLVVKNASLAPSFTNTTNIAVTNDNTLYIGTGIAANAKGYGPVQASSTANPSSYEGWIFQTAPASPTNNIQIIYSRNSAIPPSGPPTQVGYLTSTDGTQISFVISATSPISTNANNFQCFQCTGLTAGASYCNPISTGGIIAPGVDLTSFTYASWFMKSSNTVIVNNPYRGSTTINITQGINQGQTLNPGTTRSTLNSSTVFLDYTLNGTVTKYTKGTTYNLSLSTTATNAVDTNVIRTITIPNTNTLGTISSATATAATNTITVNLSGCVLPINTTVFIHGTVNNSSILRGQTVSTVVNQTSFSFVISSGFNVSDILTFCLTCDSDTIYPSNDIQITVPAPV